MNKVNIGTNLKCGKSSQIHFNIFLLTHTGTLCVRVCIYLRVCACVYMSMHILCVYMHKFVYMCRYVVCLCVDVCISVCVCACVCAI